MGFETEGKSPQQRQTVQGHASSNGRNLSQVQVQGSTLTVNVFFDGTKNNLYNIEDRRKNTTKYANKDKDDYESYFNDYSNVAHLFNSRARRIPRTSWVYIEGIGTGANDINEENRKRIQAAVQSQQASKEQRRKFYTDSTKGFAMGSGSTGIKQRVEQSFEKIQIQVRGDHGTIIPAIIRLNVFGFSRGAAAARYFIHLVKSQPQRFKGWNLKSANITVGFVGLFDTVSSYHPGMMLPEYKVIERERDLFEDVSELHLNFSRGYADKVFHITALDEYRKYFSLTTIRSAVKQGFGFEVALNGAHADIGGSYPNNSKESFMASGDAASLLKRWFVKQGFYTDEQTSYKAQVSIKDEHGKNFYTPATLYVSRSNVSNHYHKVPFKAMRLMAEKYAVNVQFDKDKAEKIEQSPHKEIQSLLNTTPAKIMRAATNGWGQSINMALPESYAKAFRNRFIHWSAKNETGYELRLKDGLPYRKTHQG